MDEVHLFLAVAKATPGNELDYPAGETHALMIFVRQPEGSDHDWTRAEEAANRSGWDDVHLSKAGSIGRGSLEGQDEITIAAYEEALMDGSSIISYSDPAQENAA